MRVQFSEVTVDEYGVSGLYVYSREDDSYLGLIYKNPGDYWQITADLEKATRKYDRFWLSLDDVKAVVERELKEV